MKESGIRRRCSIEVNASLEKRMAARVNKAADDECWNWMACFRNGYGAIKHMGRVLQAHRVAYVIARGEPPEGTVVAHKCDNRACCNPGHLEAVSAAQNNRDARERIEFNTARGEESPQAVLNEQAIATAFARRTNGESLASIARSLGVDRKTLRMAFQGKTWKHLQPRLVSPA